MSRKMLMDAAHPEEIRVIIATDNQIDDYDYQTEKKSTKGNIYLAKVTRVEPSLQAAFIDYGAEKHGFLPFAEIHPDYYQIPVADREKLLAEIRSSRLDNNENSREEEGEESQGTDHPGREDGPQFYRRYKIQEVVKKDQVILIQIEKEERGNKGASLTTYISLAGRYCVLMPNATKGGGVSRKIADAQDRKRLKDVARELSEEIDGNSSVIIRTAGAYKTKTEIKRDSQYLKSLWDLICGHIMKAHAPAFIHEEGDVIKKTLRDSYDSEIDEVLIEGKQAYNDAKNFMQMILPKHVSKLKLYEEKVPLFTKYGFENQIASIYSPQVRLKSGGYIVINHTEALVAIDVNSGKSTSERNIEDTAYRTNVEAAREIARQLRLRDLSGLIVVDFIDMEDIKNRKNVEKAFKDAIEQDKARIQMGKISTFGLLEMSRQRLRQSIVESNTAICSHCNGKGRVRSFESTAIVMLRAVEREIVEFQEHDIFLVSASAQLVFHLLNKKRPEILAMELRHGVKISFYADETAGGDGFFIEKQKTGKKVKTTKAASGIDQATYADPIPENDGEEIEVEANEHPRSSHSHSRKKMKFKSNRNDKRFPPREKKESFVKNENDDNNVSKEDEIQPKEISHERPEMTDENRHFRKRGRFDRNHKPHFKKDRNHSQKNDDFPRHSTPEADVEINNEEMAARRKQNQSLLKEIWKKIVD